MPRKVLAPHVITLCARTVSLHQGYTREYEEEEEEEENMQVIKCVMLEKLFLSEHSLFSYLYINNDNNNNNIKGLFIYFSRRFKAKAAMRS